MVEYYMPILAFHVISVLSWMAVLFYLPRLYVYHQEHKEKKEFIEVVKIQEFKLYKYIGLPAMWASIFSGGFMIYLNPELLHMSWMQAKVLLIVLLTAYYFSLEYFREKLLNNECTRDGKFFRAYNEVPTVLSLLIVGYVVTKTFSFAFTFITLAIGAFVIYRVIKQTPKDA